MWSQLSAEHANEAFQWTIENLVNLYTEADAVGMLLLKREASLTF